MAADHLRGVDSLSLGASPVPPSLARLQAVQRLKGIVGEGLLNPHAQPIVDLRLDRIVALELLFRVSPIAGLSGIRPDQCIALAEETGGIDRIGLAMFQAACTLLTDPVIRQRELAINVNLSVLQLRSPNLLPQLRRVVRQAGVPCDAICLELTESHKLDADPDLLRLLHDLADCGFRLALDDFGTGYASLAVLRSFPFSHVKVDRSFVADIEHAPRSRALCQVMLQMGEACDLTVTAEGVETREQADLLIAMGYSRLQGFLFGRPRPITELEAFWSSPSAA
ncbi:MULTISPECIES: EAL domain-containing protein [Aphanothece]|uniref:EAL domain-containing protein n=1 Tax=Aphanothece TaxID=1121 RepID=UPI003984CF16